MADALISPAVGLTLWTAAAGGVFYSARKMGVLADEKKAPLMGVLGAFVFAAQMINFTIPATGSSGHIGGGILLAVLLGPHAAFLTLASILVIQAMFFADGGLLALGCNIFNMAFLTCYVAYPLFFKGVESATLTRKKLFWRCMGAVVVGLQLGSGAVVMEVLASGVTQLPMSLFLLLMQPIHLAIGIVEGFVTTAVVAYVWQQRPEIIDAGLKNRVLAPVSLRAVFLGIALAGVITAGGLSLVASSQPDGLEWSIWHSNSQQELEAPQQGVYRLFADIQEKVAFFPDYTFKSQAPVQGQVAEGETDYGTSVAGLVGTLIAFVVAIGLGKLAYSLYGARKYAN